MMPGEENREKLKIFNVEPATARAMCYVPVFGVIAAILFVVLEKNHKLRWDAVQAVILWCIVLAMVFLLSASRILAGLIPLVNLFGVVVAPLLLAVRASQGENTKLPFIGEVVDKIIR
jgi:uncharacterized membrane protein